MQKNPGKNENIMFATAQKVLGRKTTFNLAAPEDLSWLRKQMQTDEKVNLDHSSLIGTQKTEQAP